MPPKPQIRDNLPDIALKIAKLRNSRGETQTAFAAQIDTLPSTVSKWESGRNRPTPEVFVRLSRIAEGEDKSFFLNEAGVLADFYVPSLATAQTKEGAATDAELLAKVLDAVERAMNQVKIYLPRELFAEVVAKLYDRGRQIGHADFALAKRLVDEACGGSNRKERQR
jgi:transcriptional regulator with XRE-family HTH domain